jgi:hypothetical protein
VTLYYFNIFFDFFGHPEVYIRAPLCHYFRNSRPYAMGICLVVIFVLKLITPLYDQFI